jgi:hypothetical protein
LIEELKDTYQQALVSNNTSPPEFFKLMYKQDKYRAAVFEVMPRLEQYWKTKQECVGPMNKNLTMRQSLDGYISSNPTMQTGEQCVNEIVNAG